MEGLQKMNMRPQFQHVALLLLAGFLAAGCVSRAAMQRMQEQLDYLEASNKRMERDLIRIDSLTIESSENSRMVRADVTTTLEDFRTDVQAMRETVEELRRTVDRKPPQVVYQAPTPSETAGAGTSTPEADPRQMYENAFYDVRKGNYELAIGQFRDLLTYYSQSEFTPDAHYWIGECFYSMAGTGSGDEGRHFYDSAVVEFTYLTDNFPQSDRIPTALYKLGRCYEELGQPSRARTMYERVVNDHAKSLEAKPARSRLDQLQ
jgi:tol-pal system protein YbgF